LTVRYEIRFLEIGADKGLCAFLIESVPSYSVSKIAQIIKSIIAKKMFGKFRDLRSKLWGSEFWAKGYFMSTVGKHGDEKKLRNYIKNQGSDHLSYKAFHQKQLKFFRYLAALREKYVIFGYQPKIHMHILAVFEHL